MMIFKKIFKKQNKGKGSTIKQMLSGKALELDNTLVIYKATEIISEFGDILEQTSKLVWGVSENRLPYSKQEIQYAIEVLLKFFENEESWGHFKKSFPELSKVIFTNKYYGALRCGYLELAKFIKDEDAQICEKAIKAISKTEITDDDISELQKLGFQRVIEINKRIASETHLRLKELQEKYGIQDTHPAFE